MEITYVGSFWRLPKAEKFPDSHGLMVESEAKYPHESPFRPPNPMKRDAVGCLMGGIPEFLGKIHGQLSADGRITACPAVGWAREGLEWFRILKRRCDV